MFSFDGAQINNLLLTIAEAVFVVLLFGPGWV